MTRKEKKQLLGILTWLAIIAVIVVVGLSYRKQFQYYDQAIADKKAQITRLKGQIANKPALQQTVDNINQLIKQSGIFMHTPNKQTADAELLTRVKKIIETAGGTIHSVTPIANQRNKANNSRVSIALTAKMESFVEMINQMGASKPLMNITQARLTPLWQGRARQRSETGKVNVQLQVEAFFASGVAQ